MNFHFVKNIEEKCFFSIHNIEIAKIYNRFSQKFREINASH